MQSLCDAYEQLSYPRFLSQDIIPNDMSRLILVHLGLLPPSPQPVDAAFLAGADALAPSTLGALRLVNRETFFYLLGFELPLLNAWPTEVEVVCMERTRRAAIPVMVEPRPWYRTPAFLAAAIREMKQARFVFYNLASFWLDKDTYEFKLWTAALFEACIDNGNDHVLACMARHCASFVHENLTHLRALAVRADNPVAYALFNRGLARPVARSMASFVQNTPVAAVLSTGARRIFDAIYATVALINGSEEGHVFLATCKRTHKAHPALLQEHLDQLFKRSQRLRANAQARVRRADKKRARDARAVEDERPAKRARDDDLPIVLEISEDIV